MSVIFENLENIHPLPISFSQAIRIDKYLYYIERQTLKRITSKDLHFEPGDALVLQQNVLSISTDGKNIYSLGTNGDLYKVEPSPKILIQGKNIQLLYSAAFIDQSGRGFSIATQKQIYSHCKHIASYDDRTCVITIGGKLLLYLKDQQQNVPQINGLKINCFFKKSILFSFGGIALSESGDIYCFSSKMIKLRANNLSDIVASQKYLFGIQGNLILQWKLEDFQGHQFFQNLSIFQKMNYGNEIVIAYQKQQFKEVKEIWANNTSYAFALVRENHILNTHETNQSVMLDKTFCRSSVHLLKQQLFEDWDVPKKLSRNRQSEQRLQPQEPKSKYDDRRHRESEKEQIYVKPYDPSVKQSTVPSSQTSQQSSTQTAYETCQTPMVQQSLDSFKQSGQCNSLASRVAMIKDCLNFENMPLQQQQSQQGPPQIHLVKPLSSTHSLYTLNEESSNEHSICADDEVKGIYEIQRKKFIINDIFEEKIETKPIREKIEAVKERIQERSENTSRNEEPKLDVQPLNLNSLLNKIQLNKPVKTIDSILQQQQFSKFEQESLPTFQNDDQFAKEESMKLQPRTFLRSDSLRKFKKVGQSVNNEIDCQSVIDYQNGSCFVDLQQDSFIKILDGDSKTQSLPLQMDSLTLKVMKKGPDSERRLSDFECPQKRKLEMILEDVGNIKKADQASQGLVSQPSLSSKIEQAKQNLENLVEKIQRNRDSAEKFMKKRESQGSVQDFNSEKSPQKQGLSSPLHSASHQNQILQDVSPRQQNKLEISTPKRSFVRPTPAEYQSNNAENVELYISTTQSQQCEGYHLESSHQLDPLQALNSTKQRLKSEAQQVSFNVENQAPQKEPPKMGGVKESHEIIKMIRDSYGFKDEVLLPNEGQSKLSKEASVRCTRESQPRVTRESQPRITRESQPRISRESQPRVGQESMQRETRASSYQRQSLTRVLADSNRPEKSITPIKGKKQGTLAPQYNSYRENVAPLEMQYCSVQTPANNTIRINQLATTETVDYTSLMFSATDRIPEKPEIKTHMHTQNNSPKRKPLTYVNSKASVPCVTIRKSQENVRQNNFNSSNKKKLSRNQEIVLRKLVFRLDIHVKLSKLEFMFNIKQK